MEPFSVAKRLLSQTLLCKHYHSLFIEEQFKNAFRGVFSINEADLYIVKWSVLSTF